MYHTSSTLPSNHPNSHSQNFIYYPISINYVQLIYDIDDQLNWYLDESYDYLWLMIFYFSSITPIIQSSARMRYGLLCLLFLVLVYGDHWHGGLEVDNWLFMSLYAYYKYIFSNILLFYIHIIQSQKYINKTL